MNWIRRHSFQIAGALLAALYLINGVFKSTRSTAAIGFLFVPLFALFGAFVGDALKYFIDLVLKKRSHSPAKTLLIAAVVGVCTYQWVQNEIRSNDLRIARTSTSSAELLALLQKKSPEISQAVVANPALPVQDLESAIQAHLRDYSLMSGAIRHPQVSPKMMERIAALDHDSFRSDTEYSLYQTYVWAPLVKREDVPETLVHQLAAKKYLQHFLILALLKSPWVTCEEKKRFLPQENQVLENAIRRSLASQKCAP